MKLGIGMYLSSSYDTLADTVKYLEKKTKLYCIECLSTAHYIVHNHTLYKIIAKVKMQFCFPNFTFFRSLE